MFGGLGLPFSNLEFSYTLVRNLLILAILAFAATPYPKQLFLEIKGKISGEGRKAAFTVVFDIVLVAIYALCIVYISSSDYRPNIYFEF